MENKYKSYTFSQHSLSWPKFSKAFPNNPQNQQGSKVIQIFEVGFLAENASFWMTVLQQSFQHFPDSITLAMKVILTI